VLPGSSAWAVVSALSGPALSAPSGPVPSASALSAPSGPVLVAPSGPVPSASASSAPSGPVLVAPSASALSAPAGPALVAPSASALFAPPGPVLVAPSGLVSSAGRGLSAASSVPVSAAGSSATVPPDVVPRDLVSAAAPSGHALFASSGASSAASSVRPQFGIGEEKNVGLSRDHSTAFSGGTDGFTSSVPPGPLFAHLLLSSRPAFALVDTGASHSLLSETTARRHNLFVTPSTLSHLVAADGRSMSVLGSTTALLELGDVHLNWTFLVVQPLAYDCLLGIDVLTRLRASVLVHKRRLVLPAATHPIHLVPLAFPLASSSSARAPTEDPNDPSLPTQPTHAGPEPDASPGPDDQPSGLPLLTDPLSYSDLVSAWDPKSWATGCATALQDCLWPSSHQRLLVEFADVFAPRSGSPGPAKVAPFSIPTTTNVAPTGRRSYRMSPLEREYVNTEVATMLAGGIIRPSTSRYCSPVVLVKKPDGKFRFCVDYRGLNGVTEPDRFPMPLARTIFDSLGGFTVFNTMDLAAGYFQIPLAEEDRHKTAFACDLGLFEFTCMPFGVCNGPAAFCRAMTALFAGMPQSDVSSFVDDLISPAKDEADSLRKLRAIFTRLRVASFHLRLDKCRFGRATTKYLGHMLSKAGLAVDSSKIDAVRNLDVPTSALQVRQFLGLAGYYRAFIDDYATIAAPLTALTRKYNRFHWSAECLAAFRTLQQRLTTAPVLAFPDYSRPFILTCDASKTAIGAILSQQFDEGERPIAFASRQLKPAEKRYTIMELEGLAVVWGVRYFHAYLFGPTFTVLTDHRALAFMASPGSELSDRMQRWLFTLQKYHFSIVHRAGSANANVDALSRLSRLPTAAAVFALPDPVPLGSNDIVSAQRSDPLLGPIYAFVESNELPAAADPDVLTRLMAQARSCRLDSLHRLCVVTNDDLARVWIPSSARPSVLRGAHDHMGHLGAARTLGRLQPYCFWNTMAKDVDNWCRSCLLCARGNKSHLAPAGLLQPISPSGPFDIVVMDYMGPLPLSASGNRYILVIMDHFSKWVEAIAVPTADGATTASCFVDRIVCHFGRPNIVIADNGSHFANKHVSALLSALGIEYRHGQPYHPQTQGLVERFNSTLASMLRKHVSSDQSDWDVSLPWLTWAYNSSVHSVTDVTPFQLLHGWPAPAPLQALGPASAPTPTVSREYLAKLQATLTSLRSIVADASATASAAAKAAYDKTHRDIDYSIGSLVLTVSHQHRKGLTAKLQMPLLGPYRVTAKLNPTIYELERLDGQPQKLQVHVSQLKQYTPRALEFAAPSLPGLPTLRPTTTEAPSDPSLVHPDSASPFPGSAPRPPLLPVAQPDMPVDPAPALIVPLPALRPARTVPAPADLTVPDTHDVLSNGPSPAASPSSPSASPTVPLGHYEIESIVGRRKVANEDRFKYRIKWADYDEYTWEDPVESQIPQNLIDDYDHAHPFQARPPSVAQQPPATRSSVRLNNRSAVAVPASDTPSNAIPPDQPDNVLSSSSSSESSLS